MTFTPSSTSSFSAGAVFWGMIWATLGKLNSSKLDACVAKQDETQVRASSKEALSMGIEAAPYVFVNGERFDGALPQEQVWMVIDRALRAAGVEVPAASAQIPGAGK